MGLTRLPDAKERFVLGSSAANECGQLVRSLKKTGKKVAAEKG